MKTIDIENAHQWIANKEALCLDMRDTVSFEESHIIDALHVDAEVLAELDKLNPDTPIVVCCYHGISSQSLAHYLASVKGLTEVYSLNGGFAAWSVTYPELCTKKG